MILPSWYLLVPVLLPILGGLAVAFLPWTDRPDVRRPLVMTLLIAVALLLLPILPQGEMGLTLFTLSDNLPIALSADAAGKMFALLMALLWAVVGAYALGYMAHEQREKRFYAFYLMTLGALMGLCFSASILTLYMFYEAMTLLTFPLVMHSGTKEAVAAGIKYLIYSVVGASLMLMGVFLLAPCLTTLGFVPGGALDPLKVSGREALALAASFLMILGFGAKAGMFPLHGWLPTAHPTAPSPASAVLSGVITKAGVLGIFRVIFFLVGPDFLRGTWVQTAFISLSLFTVFMGSLLAYREQLVKKRLAYSTVSQVSYVLLGLATLHPLGVIGALMHVVCHALIKDGLFMAAGSVILKTGKTRVDDLGGVGRRMPVTLWCFTLCGLGLIGIPPMVGFMSKWYLAQGALSMGGTADFLRYLCPAVLLLSALLTAGYLLPISIRAFLPGRDASGACPALSPAETGKVMGIPLALVTLLAALAGMFPGGMTELFSSLAALILEGGPLC